MAPYRRGIIVDIGTGDGLFVYNWARQDSQKFFIGIDANRRPLQKISERIHRKPSKGGLPNVLFLQAAVEALPSELNGTATEVHVSFPWGSLLRGVAAGDKVILSNLRRICSPKALLKVTIGFELERDRSEWKHLELPTMSVDYIRSVIGAQYKNAGFNIVETEEVIPLDSPEFQTSWAKRLKKSSSRSFIRIVGHAAEVSE